MSTQAPPSSWLTQIQTPRAKQWMEPGDSCGRRGGETAGPKGERNSTGRPTESTNQDPWGSESEPTNQAHTRAGPRPPRPHVADVQLGHHVGPGQLERRLSQKLLPVWERYSTSWAAMTGRSGTHSWQSVEVPGLRGRRGAQEGAHPFRAEEDGRQRKNCGKGWAGGGQWARCKVNK